CEGAFAAFDNDEDSFLGVENGVGDEHDDMPGLVSESDEEESMLDCGKNDWLYEVDKDGLASINKVKQSTDTVNYTTIVNNAPRTEVLNSGFTCHISPYCDNFSTFEELATKNF
ncbi:hypothetical protein H0H87_011838, partial [Tephrocybe sp. NHM501043]